VKNICRMLIVSIGLLSGHTARAELIAPQPARSAAAVESRLAAWGVEPAAAGARAGALTEAEAITVDTDPQAPAGGDLGTVAVVFILMFAAIFLLTIRNSD
jgi:hypothetical protein